MSAPVVQSQNKIRVAYQEIAKGKEEIEMRLATAMGKFKRWLSEGIVTQHPIKLLGGLALGTLLVTAIGLPIGLTGGDTPGRAPSSDQVFISEYWEDIDTSYEDLLDELADLHFAPNYPNHTDEAGNPFSSKQIEVLDDATGPVFISEYWEDIDTSYEDLLDELADLHFAPNYPNHTDEAGNPFSRE